MPNWYDALPTFENREALRDAIAHRKDGGDEEPSAVGEDTSGEPEGRPDVPTLPAPHIMSMLRYRKEVPGATESEVLESRTGMMRNLSVQHLQMYAARDEIASGALRTVMLDDDGKPIVT